MKSDYLIISMFVLLSIVFVATMASAETIQTLGTFKQGDTIILKQTCSNCTFINITSVIAPNGLTQLIGNTPMTKIGTDYNRTFTNTSNVGRYTVNCVGDPNGVLNADDCGYDFYITQSGEQREINPFLGLIPILFFGILMLTLGILMQNFIIKHVMWTLAFASAFIAVQYTSLVLQGYALVTDLSTHSYLLTFLEVFGWIIGGAATLFIIFTFVKIKDWLDIRKGYKDPDY